MIPKAELTFGHLKQMIVRVMEKSPTVYKNICEVKSLWKVEGLAEGGNKWTILEEIANDKDETRIEQKLRVLGNKLKSSVSVDHEFPNFVILKGQVHIVVQPPTPATTGKCLPMVYLLNKKFALSHIFFIRLGKRRHDDSDLDEESEPRKKEKSLVFSPTLLSSYVKINLHKFYDRDEALNLILDVACLNYEKCTSDDHKDHYFVQVPGGIGIGKTRIGWESQYLLSSLKAENDYTDEFKEALKDPCYIFVDLNNGCKYLMGFDDKKDSSVRIGARVAVASGLVSGRLSDLLDTNTKCLNLSNVISHILKLRLETNQQSVYAIIIHLDEFQLYIDDVRIHQKTSWELACKFFKTMLKEIGSVMRENSNANYFIVPICTGTSAIDINFLPTEYLFSKIVEPQTFEL
jgi:hypothetical protein